MSRKRKPAPVYRAVLGIDPAKSAGAALFVDGELVGYTPADGTTWKTLDAAIRAIITPAVASIPEAERLCVIEDGFLSGFGNAKGTLTLGRRRGLAQAAAESNGFHNFVFAPVPRWLIDVHGSIYKKDTKELSLARAKEVYGVEGQTDDTTDAVLLGEWALRHNS